MNFALQRLKEENHYPIYIFLKHAQDTAIRVTGEIGFEIYNDYIILADTTGTTIINIEDIMGATNDGNLIESLKEVNE